MTKGKSGNSLPIPDELHIVYLLDRMQWTYQDYLQTPAHIISELLFYWQYKDTYEEKYSNREKS